MPTSPYPLMLEQGTLPNYQPPYRRGQRRDGSNRSGSIPGYISNAREGFTRGVQDDELSGNRLRMMTDENGAYLRGVRSRANAAGTARGLGNSGIVAALGEGAAIEAAAPFALQEAERFGAVGDANLESLARQRLGEEQNATSINVADIGAGATIESQRLRNLLETEQGALNREHQTSERVGRQGWETGEREGTQGFQAGERERDRGLAREGWQFDVNEQRRRERREVAARVIDTVLNSPEYFRNPAGAAGAIQFYIDTWDEMFP